MTYCKDNEKADKIVSYIVERCNSLDSVYDYLDNLETENLSEKDFADIFDEIHGVASQYKEKAYMLYALFAHHKMRPHYALLEGIEIKTNDGGDLYSFPSDEQFIFVGGGLHGVKWSLASRLESPQEEYEREQGLQSEMQRKLRTIRTKLRFINTLMQLSRDLFVEQGEDNEHIVEKRHMFLKVITIQQFFSKKGEDNWDIAVNPSDKSFMLFYGDHILGEVSEHNNHTCPIVSTDLSLRLPMFSNGFDFCRPRVCNHGSICYMEAR